MNTKHIETTAAQQNSFTSFCRACSAKLIREIKRTKQELVAQFRSAFGGNERMLRLALNEAEALACLTEYPLLIFPTLALEKVQGVVGWQRHQQQVRNPAYAA